MTNFEIARRFSGMTSAALAEALGVSPQQVTNWATGLRTPSRNSVERIAGEMSVDAAWLLGVAQALPVLDAVGGRVYQCPIMRSERLEGYGVFYVVWLEELGNWLPVIQANGVQFTPRDWDSGYNPKRADQIGEGGWIDHRGREAVMIDGLPRMPE